MQKLACERDAGALRWHGSQIAWHLELFTRANARSAVFRAARYVTACTDGEMEGGRAGREAGKTTSRTLISGAGKHWGLRKLGGSSASVEVGKVGEGKTEDRHFQGPPFLACRRSRRQGPGGCLLGRKGDGGCSWRLDFWLISQPETAARQWMHDRGHVFRPMENADRPSSAGSRVILAANDSTSHLSRYCNAGMGLEVPSHRADLCPTSPRRFYRCPGLLSVLTGSVEVARSFTRRHTAIIVFRSGLNGRRGPLW